MATLSKLKVGQVVYSVESGRMGHTTISTVSVYEVQIKEIHEDHVIASWNSNKPQRFGRREIGRWRISKPLTKEGFFGSARLLRRDEIKALKEKGERGGDNER